ncbi:nucleic acid/nucleotide deaminase domain-containing protein, partial [Paenibacillus sp. NPDC058910]
LLGINQEMLDVTGLMLGAVDLAILGKSLLKGAKGAYNARYVKGTDQVSTPKTRFKRGQDRRQKEMAMRVRQAVEESKAIRKASKDKRDLYFKKEKELYEALKKKKASSSGSFGGAGKAGSSGSKGVLNVKQVEYGSDDLSKAAQQFRIDNNITGGQNVLIAEVEVNGVVKRYQIVSTREEIVVGEETVEKITHSEKIFDGIMKKEGISPDQVKRLYSEREPCILDGHNCRQLLSKEYPNAEVIYSFEYGDQKSRNRGNKKLKQALKQLFGIN